MEEVIRDSDEEPARLKNGRCEGIRRDGKRCQKARITGRRFCRSHHGNAAAGPASGKFKHGKYSKYLPKRLLDQYQILVENRDQLTLSHELALLDTRLQDLLTRVDTEESGAIWHRLRETYERFEKAQALRQVERMEEALVELGGLIREGHGDYEAWVGIHKVIEQRRKLSDTEQRRLVSSVTVIQQQEALALIAAMTEAVTRNILGLSTRLPDELQEHRGAIERLSKSALSGIVVELHHLMSKDQVAVYGLGVSEE